MISFSYQENAKRVSSIVRDQPMSPADTVVFWVEYVLRHGGAPHLKPASVYQENAKRVSSIVRDQPMSPADTVVFWVEYVLRHGGLHLKLPLYQENAKRVSSIVRGVVVCLGGVRAPHLKPASVYRR
ncbi:hypothetical protein J6590_080987 [Homalodisca vitripennis]|nr:hypothetical protein J6590_080987 [Homalodisca vitripennis]